MPDFQPRSPKRKSVPRNARENCPVLGLISRNLVAFSQNFHHSTHRIGYEVHPCTGFVYNSVHHRGTECERAGLVMSMIVACVCAGEKQKFSLFVVCVCVCECEFVCVSLGICA